MAPVAERGPDPSFPSHSTTSPRMALPRTTNCTGPQLGVADRQHERPERVDDSPSGALGVANRPASPRDGIAARGRRYAPGRRPSPRNAGAAEHRVVVLPAMISRSPTCRIAPGQPPIACSTATWRDVIAVAAASPRRCQTRGYHTAYIRRADRLPVSPGSTDGMGHVLGPPSACLGGGMREPLASQMSSGIGSRTRRPPVRRRIAAGHKHELDRVRQPAIRNGAMSITRCRNCSLWVANVDVTLPVETVRRYNHFDSGIRER
jgi:hypothetical protein